MTFLTILGVTEILCSFRLVLEGKTVKEIPESSRLEFLEKFSANNFALSDAEDNTSGEVQQIYLHWEQFNKHFFNIAKTIEKEIPSAKNKFSDYLKNPIEKSFFINRTTPMKLRLKSNVWRIIKQVVQRVSLQVFLKISENL